MSQFTELVRIGAYVEVELVSASGQTERLAFDLVRDAAADFAAGFLGVGTPLGQAIVGQAAGDAVPYRMADVVAARIVRVTESTRVPDVGAAETRRVATRRGGRAPRSHGARAAVADLRFEVGRLG